MSPVLEVRSLETHFFTRAGVLPAVNRVSFSVDAGETLAIVGESGSGKSVTAMSILGLVPNPPGRTVGGEVLLNGHDLLKMTAKEMRRIRGKGISMIFQEPMTSLNPAFTVGNQISEAIREHEAVSRKVAYRRCIELLELVGMPDPHRCAREYPHRLSGGMRQRVMIAQAVSCNPTVLIADEPTTALDVTIQAQVLRLLNVLQRELGMALILITHDLGIVAEVANDVVVMYAGSIVEEAPIDQLFERPLHPYTQGLLRAIPRINRKENCRNISLEEIKGTIPSLLNMPKGCSFSPRCPKVIERCRKEKPALEVADSKQKVSCFVAHAELAEERPQIL